MHIQLKKFASGYRAMVQRNGVTVAMTLKARNNRNAAVIDAMTLRIAIQGA